MLHSDSLANSVAIVILVNERFYVPLCALDSFFNQIGKFAALLVVVLVTHSFFWHFLECYQYTSPLILFARAKRPLIH